MPTVQMYCVKCRKKVAVANPTERIIRGGRSRVPMRSLEGRCPICGTKVHKFTGRA